MKIEIGSNTGERPEYIKVDAFGSPDVRGDLLALPFAPRSVEEVYASHVLEHVPNARIVPALKEINRVLITGGRLVLYVPDFIWQLRKFLSEPDAAARWGLHLEQIFGSQEHEGQYHRTAFSAWRLGKCLEMAGFREIDLKRVRRKDRKRGSWHPMEVMAHASP